MASRGYPAACKPECAELARKLSYEATRVVRVRGEAVPVRYTANLPPDTWACIAWLCDSRRNWRGRAKLEAKEQRAGETECPRPAAEAERIDDCVAGTAVDPRGSGHDGQYSLPIPARGSAVATAGLGPKCPKCPKFDGAFYAVDLQAFSPSNFRPIRLA